MSGIYDVTLAAGASERILVPGHRVKVIAAPAGAVRIRTSQGEQISLMEGQGFRTLEKKEFGFIVVTNTAPSAQSVLVWVGNDSFEDTRITGDVRVVDQVSAGIVTAGSVPLTAITGFTTDAILLPGANPRGVIVRALQIGMQAGAGGTVNGRIIAAPTAPVATTGNLYTFAIQASSGSYAESSLFDLKKRIPAGWGLWYFYQVTGAVALVNSYNIAYEPQ